MDRLTFRGHHSRSAIIRVEMLTAVGSHRLSGCRAPFIPPQHPARTDMLAHSELQRSHGLDQDGGGRANKSSVLRAAGRIFGPDANTQSGSS